MGLQMIDMKQIKENMSGKLKHTEESASDARVFSVRQDKSPVSNTPMAIGSTIKIKGDVTGEEDLIIHGQVIGDISLKNHNVIIGKNGDVRANITARQIVVEGSLNGDLKGEEKVVIKETGNVLGNVVSPRVTLEDGAMFKGSIEMEPSTDKRIDKNISRSIESNNENKKLA